MKLKFKVRIKRHMDNIYCVQYSYSFLIPFWITIKYWDNPTTYDYPISDGWRPLCGSFKFCEEKATQFKTIEDVRNYMDFSDKIKKYKLLRKLELKKHRPYYIKNIL